MSKPEKMDFLKNINTHITPDGRVIKCIPIRMEDTWSCIPDMNKTTDHEYQNKVKYIGVLQMRRVNAKIDRINPNLTKRQRKALAHKK